MTETLLFDIAPLAPAIARGALVLTPNRRLASRIRLALAAGHAVVPTAPVFAIGDWIEQLWQQMVLRGDPLAVAVWVLSPAQELLLWEQAVRAGDILLLRPAQAAEQAQSAYRTLALWRQLPLSAMLRDECAAQPDSAMFVQWLDHFELSCEKRGAIASAERERRVVAAARQQRLHLPVMIVSVGFDDISPLYAELLQLVTDYSELASRNRQQQAACVGLNSLEVQLQAAALWAQRELQKNPEGPIAIVVPDLNQQRTLVERTLLDVLTPEHALPQQLRRLPPLNFSSGEALAQTPLIRSALQLLDLISAEIERETLLQIARSPFSAFANETIGAQAAFIEAICQRRATKLRIAQVRQCADHTGERFPEWRWGGLLHALGERARREHWASAKYSAKQWGELFGEALTVLGWPGTRSLDSVEYQQHTHWQQALIEFARYDQIGAPLNFATALQRLQQLLQVQVFQAQTADTPLQVLGVLEAAGLQFKALWLCDMGDDRWPAAAAPHPLLPRDLQRRLRMPRCDAERELAIAQRLTASLLASAETVVVSYQNEREEVQRGPSALFHALPEITAEELLNGALSPQLPASVHQKNNQSRFELEKFMPGRAPQWTPAEIVRGGSALLKDQAACAFRAFATHRLNAYPLDEPVVGLDAAERGSILHAALEFIWRELETQSALIALDDNAQNAVIQRAAETALRDFAARDPQRLGPRFIALEQQRLQRLLSSWLAIERERGEFTVYALEQTSRAEFNGLPLRLRVDRIDKLANGRFLIIDYKTKSKNCSINEWLGDRLDEPQLPLYAEMLENRDALAGIAFAQVRLDKPQMVGVGDLDERGFTLPTQFSDDFSIENWDDLQKRWREVLSALAQQFIDGYAEVDPKARNTCDFCDLDSICRRYHEAVLPPLPPGEGEG
jgi:ATP-dependent helicase/nuclease subunit B